jgi:polyphosphate kinase
VEPLPQVVGANARCFNRHQSWLQFNLRVLEEALDGSLPTMERARFLAITANNLDEFVMVQVAEMQDSGDAVAEDGSDLTAAERLAHVRLRLADLVSRTYACWRDEVAPLLAQHGFRILAPEAWGAVDHETLASLYRTFIEPTLTPQAVDGTRPFPRVANKALNIAVLLTPAAGSDEPRHALVSVPKGQRLLALLGSDGRWALLEDVIAAYLGSLFPGETILATTAFRVTRDSSIELEEDPDADLLAELEEELRNRGRGTPVRLELRAGCDQRLADWLRHSLRINDADCCLVDGPLDLSFLFSIEGRLGRTDLSFPPFEPRRREDLEEDLFATVRAGDVLLHHPFESFDPVVRMVQLAASDRSVLAIKQTLYRVSGDSPVVKALVSAARAGKQVTVLVELKARFDEEANIRWARALEDAGAHVVYGLQGLKVHSKLLLVVRREEDGIRRYVHLGTGNYNDRTARIYTDLSLLTADETVGRDVAKLFNIITGFAHPIEFERLAVSPITMRPSFSAWILREIEHARAGRPARIAAKFNSLVDEGIADELYAASQAGVRIELVVRGMCIVRPGVPGLSENIRVISVVGRFLEHSRIYYFHNDGDPVVAIASADWMTRNLDRRVEQLVRLPAGPVRDQVSALLQLYLADNCKARQLRSDGAYERLQPPAGSPGVDAQALLLARPLSHTTEEFRAAPAFVPLKNPRKRK